MLRSTRLTFGVHWVVALILGLPLLIAPGRFLDLVNWVPEGYETGAAETLISRMFGAALIALAWGSFRSWRATSWDQVGFIVELETVFTVLAALGLLRHLVLGGYSWTVWATFALLVLFAIAWIGALIRDRK